MDTSTAPSKWFRGTGTVNSNRKHVVIMPGYLSILSMLIANIIRFLTPIHFSSGSVLHDTQTTKLAPCDAVATAEVLSLKVEN